MEKLIDNINETFTTIYKDFSWYMGQNESRSGLGSTLEWTSNFKSILLKFISEKNINTILDCSCGDWNWMRTISDSLPNYIGLDCVQEAIDYNNKNYSKDNIKFICSDMNTYLKNIDYKFDLIIIRHTLEHLPLQYATESVSLTKEKSKYSFITSFSEKVVNIDLDFPKETYRPIYLESDPFVSILGKPIEKYYDGPETNKISSHYPEINLYENN